MTSVANPPAEPMDTTHLGLYSESIQPKALAVATVPTPVRMTTIRPLDVCAYHACPVGMGI